MQSAIQVSKATYGVGEHQGNVNDQKRPARLHTIEGYAGDVDHNGMLRFTDTNVI